MIVDLSFNYKFIVKFILIHKSILFSNVNEIPSIHNILLYFSSKDLLILDDPRVFNYFYLFRFFLGKDAYLTKYRNIFHLGKHYYSFNVRLILNRKYSFFVISFLLNDIKSAISPDHFKGYFLTNNTFLLTLRDLNIFVDKKTNVGLFNLHNSLVIKFFFTGPDWESSSLLLDSLKFI